MPMPASGGGQAKEPNKTDKEILCQRQPIDTKTAAMVTHAAAYLKLPLIYNRNTYSNAYYTQGNSNNNSFYISVYFRLPYQKRVGIH